MFYLQYGFFDGLPLYMSKNGCISFSIHNSLSFETKENAEYNKKRT